MGNGYEIDFLAVGEGQKSGDAIALRYGDLEGDPNNQFVAVIDGGTKESGKALVKHIKARYKTSNVNVVFLTHADADHASGLTEVLRELNVFNLCMHRPWMRPGKLKDLFKDGRITTKSLRDTLVKSLNNAKELEEIAIEKNIRLIEPYSDNPVLNDEIAILGPSQKFYEEMLANFEDTPTPTTEAVGLKSVFREGLEAIIEKIEEHWNVETLQEPDLNSTSAENNTSLILHFNIYGRSILFTGDAGVPALIEASKKAESLGISLAESSLIQVPHHGSKRNVGPAVLDMLVGPKLQSENANKSAFVSAAKEGSPKHPSKRVLNAFKRRGCNVCSTAGVNLLHQQNGVPRTDYGPANIHPFYGLFED